MTDQHQPAPHPLRSTLGLLERETARRAKGSHPGMMRLDDAELAALLDLLRRELGTDTSSENTLGGREIDRASAAKLSAPRPAGRAGL